MTTDFRGNGYSKNGLICDCAITHSYVITLATTNVAWVRFPELTSYVGEFVGSLLCSERFFSPWGRGDMKGGDARWNF